MVLKVIIIFLGSGSQDHQSTPNSLNLMILRVKKFFGIPTFLRFFGILGVFKVLRFFQGQLEFLGVSAGSLKGLRLKIRYG